MISTDRVRVGEWLVEPRRNLVSRDGAEHQLEPLTMDVLAYLLAHPGRVISTEELMREVWADRSTQPAAVKKRIGQIRAALGDSTNHSQYISTIPKRGYCLTAPVEGVSLWKAILVDMVFLHQNAIDEINASTDIKRQQLIF